MEKSLKMLFLSNQDTICTLYIFILSLLPFTQAFTTPESTPVCHLPTGKAAFCVPLQECGHVMGLIRNLQRPLPSDVALLLRESFFCSSSRRGGVSVCCPLDGLVTPAENRPDVPDRDDCEMQGESPAECVLYNQCSPFTQLLGNLRRPFPPAVPSIIRSSYLCGIDSSTGQRLPKICCPSGALQAQETATTTQPPPETTTEPADPYHAHPGRAKLASNDDCGLTLGTRIVNGRDAELGEFPWLVNLGYSSSRSPGKPLFKCGGTLVGSQYVLTAAHCVTELPRGFSLSVVRVGEHDLSRDVDCTSDGSVCNEPPQDVEIERVVFHESYGKPKAFQNDIAVIKLAREVLISDFVAPICLPFLHEDDENYLSTRMNVDDEERRVFTDVAGWGATTPTGRRPADILQVLEVNITDSDNCKEIYAERGGVLTDKQICAGGEKGKVREHYLLFCLTDIAHGDLCR
jgi:hypothetical protein